MTLKAGVIGWPISHSKSPLIHSFWIQSLGLNATYEAIAIEPENFVAGVYDLIKKGFQGANVTIPHKEAAFQICDARSERAQKIGAVNTLVFRKGQIFGDNTDGEGFLQNITTNHPTWSVKNGPALVIGAGGASRAIICALIEVGCPEIRIWNRTFARAKRLQSEFGKPSLAWMDTLDKACEGASFLVNTTSLGMKGQDDLVIDLSGLNKGALVTDIVYTPLITPLLCAAKASGFPVVDGFGMLLHQAVPGFEYWFGVRPAVTEKLRKAVLK
ncbi:MAG: shikimate dehydrogenase [Pseudomonadota bacterium]